jgi:GNAT superfamily N-acetyltransferase
MRMEVSLRRAVSSDVAAAAELWVRARHQSAPAIPPPVHSDGDMLRYFSDVVFVDSDVWLAESEDGRVVGVMVLHEGWLEHLYLEAEWTGRGIGARLVELAKGLSPDGLQLWAFVSNAGACRFYERHGFVAVERTDGSGNEEHAPDVRYLWRADQGSKGPAGPVALTT